MPHPPTIFARLGPRPKYQQSGDRRSREPYWPVLCGRLSEDQTHCCHQEVARVLVVSRGGFRQPTVLTLPDFKPDESGVYALTAGARRRWDRDRRLASANRGEPHDLVTEARRRIREGRAPLRRRTIDESHNVIPVQDVIVLIPPANIRCPRCRGVSRVSLGPLEALDGWDPRES